MYLSDCLTEWMFPHTGRLSQLAMVRLKATVSHSSVASSFGCQSSNPLCRLSSYSRPEMQRIQNMFIKSITVVSSLIYYYSFFNISNSFLYFFHFNFSYSNFVVFLSFFVYIVFIHF